MKIGQTEFSGSFEFTVEDDEDVELACKLLGTEPVYIDGKPHIITE